MHWEAKPETQKHGFEDLSSCELIYGKNISPHQFPKTLCASSAWQDPQHHFRQAEARFLIVHRHSIMRSQSNL
ncbi:hypothetical protein RvY_16936, partial [Ramazzottius varieornatus]